MDGGVLFLLSLVYNAILVNTSCFLESSILLYHSLLLKSLSPLELDPAQVCSVHLLTH